MVRLHLVGAFESAEFERKLMAAIVQCELNEQIVFLGTQTGAAKDQCFLESDVFCYPTYFESETFGAALIEAMHFDSRSWRQIGVVPSSIVEGENGFLVPIRDPRALADKIEF